MQQRTIQKQVPPLGQTHVEAQFTPVLAVGYFSLDTQTTLGPSIAIKKSAQVNSHDYSLFSFLGYSSISHWQQITWHT